MAQLLGALGDLVAGRGRIVLLHRRAGNGQDASARGASRARRRAGHVARGPLPLVRRARGVAVRRSTARLARRRDRRARDRRPDEGSCEARRTPRRRARRACSPLSGGSCAYGSTGRTTQESADRIREAYVRWLEALARERPVVVALEDVHWADTSTRELAEAVLDLAERAPIALILTAGARTRLGRRGAPPARARATTGTERPRSRSARCRTRPPRRCCR